MKPLTTLTLTLLLPLLGACVAAPVGPPEAFAGELAALLDEGDTAGAAERFAAVADRGEYRDHVYPALYSSARERYEGGDAEGAARYLRFLTEQYPEAIAARRALLYALFLERAERPEADPALLTESEALLAELERRERPDERAEDGWLALVATQVAIDRGDLSRARASLASFLEDWNGQPEALWPYVEDVDRYLASHR